MTGNRRLARTSRGVKEITGRIGFIQVDVQCFGCEPQTLEERFGGSELKRLRRIRSKLRNVREEVVEALITGYRLRTRGR